MDGQQVSADTAELDCTVKAGLPKNLAHEEDATASSDAGGQPAGAAGLRPQANFTSVNARADPEISQKLQQSLPMCQASICGFSKTVEVGSYMI